MTIQEKIFSLWSSDAGAVVLVPATRFKPSGFYQNLAFPHVIFHRITGDRYRTIEEGAADTFDREVWQFSIHTSVNAAESSAEAIRRKLIAVFDGNHAGFNFHYRSVGPTITSQDQQYLMLPVDFLVTSTV